MLNNIELIDEVEVKGAARVVRLGSTVKFFDHQLEKEFIYAIVGSVEADPLNSKLSNETPLAQAILGSKIDDVVTVEVEEPYDVKILDIN